MLPEPFLRVPGPPALLISPLGFSLPPRAPARAAAARHAVRPFKYKQGSAPLFPILLCALTLSLTRTRTQRQQLPSSALPFFRRRKERDSGLCVSDFGFWMCQVTKEKKESGVRRRRAAGIIGVPLHRTDGRTDGRLTDRESAFSLRVLREFSFSVLVGRSVVQASSTIMPSRPPQREAGITRVLSWGAGEDGQLGLDNAEDRRSASCVDALSDVPIRGVVAGSRNSLAFSDDGQLFTWGWNQRGTLGHAPDQKAEYSPSEVKALSGTRIVQAAIGGWHCLAVDEGGRAYAWGGNEYGQGAEDADGKDGKKLNRDIPIPQRCAPRLRVKQVAAGGTHSVVLTQDGQVWSWGQPWPPGDIKQIATPVRVQGLKNVRLIAVGAFHNLALLESGQVWAWGNNEYGQLGIGDTQPRALPVLVKKLSGLVLVDIAAGGWHSMALTANGQVYGWGRGEHGRLGFDDDKSSKLVPTQVQLLAHEMIIQISCGGTHSVALTEDGRMFSFGRGDHGRLGDGRRVTTGHPVEIAVNLPPPAPKMGYGNGDGSAHGQEASGRWRVKLVACGGQHTLAVAAWEFAIGLGTG